MDWDLSTINWQVNEVGEFVEVVPIGDDKEHLLGDECWCKPEVINEEDIINFNRPVISHNALDGRK